jgi:hypothetical protein
MLGGGYFCGFRMRSGRQSDHTGKNGQTVRKQLSHIEITSFQKFGFLKEPAQSAAGKIQGMGAEARISGVCVYKT